ncbi:MAG: exodeoxyribonuclease VII large subunit [Gammaproteobacteria bacterium]
MGTSTAATQDRDIYTVSRLNRSVGDLLEGSFPLLWVEGELSNLARPSSGHWYFSLKDAAAQVRCAMFRGRNQRLQFKPEDGMQVLVRARVGLYEARGEFQLIAEHMEEAGDGALRRAFEELKQRLASEGLFDPDRKQAVPSLPQAVGVITSPTGAAIRDILSVLKRRFPSIPVLIYPVPVQGEGAAAQIAAAIQQAGRRKECDVLIVARGGGSLEDLWAFNEEVVARAMHACPIPMVCGIGHEVDFSIADFVADHRAPTPSAAAEMVSPDQAEWIADLADYDSHLQTLIANALAARSQQLQWLGKRLTQQHPGTRLRQQAQRVDDLEQRFRLALRGQLREVRAGIAELRARLHRHVPQHRILQLQTRFSGVRRRLQAAIHHEIKHRRQLLVSTTRALDAISPLATLARGYAIMTGVPGGRVLRSTEGVGPGDQVQARLAKGTLICTVKETKSANS